MSPSIQLGEADLIQSLCRKSFYEFVREFWDVLIPEIFVSSWYHKVICDEMESMAFRVFKRKKRKHDLVINVPPGTTKSTICTIMFPAWVWTFMPEARFLCLSYEQSLSLTFARKSRDLVRSEKYQECFRFKKTLVKLKDPKTKEIKKVLRWRASTDKDALPVDIKQDVDAKGFFENTFSGDRKSIGVGGQAMGTHSHFILADDPINPKVAVSKPKLKSVNDFFDDTLPTRKVDKKVTPTILIMQRLHQDDPSGHMLERAKKNPKNRVHHICLPPKESPGASILPKILVFKYRKNGGYLDPVRLSDSVLEEAKNILGLYGYAGQFDQSPIPISGGMFNTSLVEFGTPPPDTDFRMIVRYWDKGGTQDGGTKTSGVKIGHDKWDRIWVLHVITGQWGSTERNKVMRQTAEADGKHVRIYVEQEPGSGGKESMEYSIGTVFRGYSCMRDIPRGDKTTRAEPFAGQMGIGKIMLPLGSASWATDYLEELRHFPLGKFRDSVDASSGAFNRLFGLSGKRAGVLYKTREVTRR